MVVFMDSFPEEATGVSIRNTRTRCGRRQGCATAAQPPLPRSEFCSRFKITKSQRAGRPPCDSCGVWPTSAAGDPLCQRLPPGGFDNAEGFHLAVPAGLRGVHGQGLSRGRSVTDVYPRPGHAHDWRRRVQGRQERRPAHPQFGVLAFDAGAEGNSSAVREAVWQITTEFSPSTAISSSNASLHGRTNGKRGR